MNNPLSICIGKCLICGKMIEVIPSRGSGKITNIFTCPSCEIRLRVEKDDAYAVMK